MVDDDLAAVTPTDDALFGDVAGLIDTARTRAAAAVNTELVMLYWSIGKRVREEILGGQRAAYGEQVVKRLAVRLTERYGRGWSRRSVERMMRFADVAARHREMRTTGGQIDLDKRHGTSRHL